MLEAPLLVPETQDCALTGTSLLETSYFNKGSAFDERERKEFGLVGLVPPGAQTLEEQCTRAYQQYSSRPNALAKNTFMTSLKEQNQVLYYRLLQDHIKEMFPIIYTPTEGEAIQDYSRLFRKPSGCYLNISHPDELDASLAHWGGASDIDLIVVSDGEQILGIGDQGVGGVLISVAKLVIYTLCAGIHPNRTLPVILDTGTDSPDLLHDELYLGLRRPRIRGDEYDGFVDAFFRAARTRFPKALIHCEDFGLANARRILDQYRDQFALFNDDVQGTGCVTLAALLAALKVSGVALADARVLCFGAGSAGVGIADHIVQAICSEASKSKADAAKHIWCFDKPGLLLKSHGDSLSQAQAPYARDDGEFANTDVHTADLQSVIRAVKPHVLIGTSTQPKAFTKAVVQEMAAHVERPIVFPLSNPTRLHEADPKDVNAWTAGRALIATGSPFPPVEHDGVQYVVAECNNSMIYPAIGLGAILSRASRLSDEMLVAATKALAEQAPALKDPNLGLLPEVTEVRELSVQIAAAVVRQVVRQGLNAETRIPEDDAELDKWVRVQMWEPKYRPLRKVSQRAADR